jgi:hypothetical protein
MLFGMNPARLRIDRTVTWSAALVLALSMLGACQTEPRYALDSARRIDSSKSIEAAHDAKPVVLKFEWRKHGEVNKDVTVQLTPKVLQVVRDSRQFTQVRDDGTDLDRLEITIDQPSASASGMGGAFVSGLTLGAVGSMVEDHFDCTVVFTRLGKEPVTRHYDHRMYTRFGQGDLPAGSTPCANRQAAVETLVEELVSAALTEIHQKDLIP